MPRVTVNGKLPKGLPKASTVSPGRSLVESPQGNAGQIVRIDLDDRQVVQLVHADHLGREDAPVIQRDADLRSAVDHVIVGDDVAVGRDDDAAADAVLDLRLRLHLLAVGPEEELAESGRQILRIDAAEILAVVGALVVGRRRAT